MAASKPLANDKTQSKRNRPGDFNSLTGRAAGKKGGRHQITKIKETIGLTGIEKFREYLKGAGAEKLVEEMQKLTGYQFAACYNTLAEYIMPKLSRQEVNVKVQHMPVLFSDTDVGKDSDKMIELLNNRKEIENNNSGEFLQFEEVKGELSKSKLLSKGKPKVVDKQDQKDKQDQQAATVLTEPSDLTEPSEQGSAPAPAPRRPRIIFLD